MPYNKTNWKDLPDVSTPINAGRLNKMETQHEQAVADAKVYTDQAVLAALPVPQAIEAAERAEAARDASEGWRNQAETFSATTVELQDAAVAALIDTPGSETQTQLNVTIVDNIVDDASDPNGTITLRGGKTKTDGQNVRNLRRPTLLIDRTFPNARIDHTILWVDESIGRLYALGTDGRLRLQTWTPGAANVDFGAVGGPRSSSPVGTQWASRGLFFRTLSGALITEEADTPSGDRRLIRSAPASDGAAWGTVHTMRGDVLALGPQSIAQDPITGHLYFPEYSGGSTLTEIRIYRSIDDGVTWDVWVERPKSPGGNGTFRHFHSARWDSVSGRVYFTVGDQNDVAGLYRVNEAGTDIEPVITNAQIKEEFGLVAPARAVDVMFFPTHIAWACDGSGGQNHVYRIARTEIGKPSPVVEQVAAIDNTGWFAQSASDDGTMWVCCASSEYSGASANADPDIAHLYCVTNNGADVDEVAAVSMDGVFGAGSLSAVPGRGGDTFWLRAHGHTIPPYAVSSGFQFRARIGNGVVPLIKPVNMRQGEYVRESRNFVGDLTASQTKTFAHTRVGRARRLRILEMGVKVLTGTANTVKLQVYNVTTGTVVHELPGAYQSQRQGYGADTAEYAYEYVLGDADQLEFRLVETGGGAVTVSAHITFGYAPRTFN